MIDAGGGWWMMIDGSGWILLVGEGLFKLGGLLVVGFFI